MIDDTVIKILVALLGGSGIGGGIVAYISRRTPDASQQQLSRDAFYATLDERERAAQQMLREREAYWLKEVQERDKQLDACERGHAQAAAELKAAQDRIEWLQQRLATSSQWEEHWRRKAEGEK